MARLLVWIGVTMIAGTTGCRSEPVDPQELLTAHHLGLGDLRKGQLPQAEEQFKKVVALAPDDPLGHANLGLTYLRGGRYEEAEQSLRRARRLSPQNVDVALIEARLHSLTDREADARKTLESLGRDPRVLYALAELDARDSSAAGAARYEGRLREVLVAAPANLAVRLRLVDLLVRRGQADSAARHLEDIRRLRPEPPREARPYLDSTIARLKGGRVAEARPTFDRFMRMIETTQPFQSALEAVRWLEGPIVGRPVLAFNPQSLITSRGIIPIGRSTEVRFTDVTSDAGFPASSGSISALAVGDYDGDGTDDVFVSDGKSAARLYHVQGGYVVDATDRSGLPSALSLGATFATFADTDNDGWLDLFAIGGDGRGYLLRNSGTGAFQDVTAKAGLARIGGARRGVFVDADHDGDIDLFLVGDTTRLFRNNLDGTFTETATAAGFQPAASRDAAFGDIDDDGRVDLVVAHVQGDRIYRNLFQRFLDATDSLGIASSQGAGAIAVTDYDNDGWLDIVAISGTGELVLWRSRDGKRFERDRRSGAGVPGGGAAPFMAPLDYDNDGWLDIAVLSGSRATLLRNDGSGRFQDRSRSLPPTLKSGSAIVPSDVDGDGDLDLFIAGANGLLLLRNDGGNARMAMQVQLVGLRTSSGKNNTFGTGARIEVRSGELFQTRVVTDRVTHFGLGSHLKADVIRVQWTNGVPETIHFPGTDEDILELEQLKGSCAFLYTWDGTRFRFVTDVMWRSALGMPLGIMAGGRQAAYAPAGASQEYLRIPGDLLRPREGRYVLQLTEELWETAYLDEVKLLAVDHPDSVEVFVDERFVPPGPTALRMFRAARRQLPRTAVDERGTDVLPALSAQDDRYVGNFVPLQYQGLVQPHDLVMDLGPDAGRAGSHLFLRGWIYPTDASINVALGQQSALKAVMPALEVRNARGQWEAVADIGFPSGKDKTIVLDLAGKFPTSDHRVRIRTNMRIHWDHAFVAIDDAAAPVRTTVLPPMVADLHFRGYSRMYRRGGRDGPHWFAYEDVATESPWRTIEGSFTRFGDVLPLLGASDDMYVVMAPGDETTVEFDARAAAALAPGWKRTFLLYTDGWIKDADLNTAHGNTVEPLPFHANKTYPYGPGESYPANPALEQYRQRYNSRVVKR